MYRNFFGLAEMPFHVTPDPKFLFLTQKHQEALEHLLYGIRERKGFIVLTGEVGCGKTTLSRRLLNELDSTEFDTALILNPKVSAAQLPQLIFHELGAEDRLNTTQDPIVQLNQLLIERVQSGKNIVLIIDEAQNLPLESLEQLRLLSNLETDSQKLLQIVLLGQPELKDVLNKPELRQLKQRVLVHYDLGFLNHQETIQYIQHRLTLSGAKGAPNFTPRAIKKVYRYSAGTPRLINHICDKSLLSAYIRDSGTVNYFDVRRAIKDIQKLS